MTRSKGLPRHIAISDARRIALAAQGFGRPRPGRTGITHVRRAIRELGLLQMDPVNVLVPAHYLVPFSRIGPYRATLLDDLVYRRREFTEQWAHEASIVPVDRWPLFRYYLKVNPRRERELVKFMKQHASYAASVLAHVERRGAVTAAEVPDPGTVKRRPGWGLWTRAKAALEGHFALGTLAVAARHPAGRARIYDLAHRVVPPKHVERAVPFDEAMRQLLLLAARAHGVAVAADLADYYRTPIAAARRHLADLVAEGALHQVTVEGWREPAYLHPEAPAPKAVRAAALLSPFDPVVWNRPRTERLFGFDYKIEIYLPKPQRKWGYYVLPFLLGERLVARVDLKADRQANRLDVLAAWIEPGAKPAAVAPALATELGLLAKWLGLDDLRVEPRGDLARTLTNAIKRR